MSATGTKCAVAGKNLLKKSPVIRASATTVASGPVFLRLASGNPASGVRVNCRNLNQIGGPLPLVLLLAACGGGGGGGTPVVSTPPLPKPANPTTSTPAKKLPAPASEPERMVGLSGSLYDGRLKVRLSMLM